MNKIISNAQALSDETTIIQELQKGKTNSEYSPQLRSFALTLNFYSPKPYNYIRKVFQNKLPAPSTIRAWYSNIDGSPGFSQQSLNILKRKSEEACEKQLFACLTMDEMAIRKQVQWSNSKKHFIGYVDHGGVINFEYFEKFVQLQENGGFHLANKLNCKHIQWYKNKMNVKLAVQTLSESCATAFEQLENDGHPDFVECAATARFCYSAMELNTTDYRKVSILIAYFSSIAKRQSCGSSTQITQAVLRKLQKDGSYCPSDLEIRLQVSAMTTLKMRATEIRSNSGPKFKSSQQFEQVY
ncbi:THAP domain-containing protein 9 [Trachymyrmex cornetzi]|uniref:THAP domain-containing protein 9 n=1 Tax=Trachymyrmex cornetzi TaxID=471704 RepID=A0A151JC39_9HYME|nr:THAP domain-containing protein 9 [Trachymyrmex cornetzi]